MSSSSNINSIAFNVAGSAVLVIVVGYMIMSYLTTPAVVACTQRYQAGQQFTLNDLDGGPLSPIELQGRTGTREWGLLKNAKVLGSKASSNLEISLASTEDEDHASQNGVGFVWPVRELGKATAACLSYGTFLPSGFAFKEPGFLPGLYSAADLAQIDDPQPEDSFAVRMGWATGGDVGIDVRTPTHTGYWEGATHKKLWPVGRWVKVEQEVILNETGKSNGALRVWIDGALTINKSGVPLRNSVRPGLSGVVADIGYARSLSDVAALKFSPFMVQWQ